MGTEVKETLTPDKEPRYNQLELSEKERKLIEFIREPEFGSLTVGVQSGGACGYQAALEDGEAVIAETTPRAVY